MKWKLKWDFFFFTLSFGIHHLSCKHPLPFNYLPQLGEHSWNWRSMCICRVAVSLHLPWCTAIDGNVLTWLECCDGWKAGNAPVHGVQSWNGRRTWGVLRKVSSIENMFRKNKRRSSEDLQKIFSDASEKIWRSSDKVFRYLEETSLSLALALRRFSSSSTLSAAELMQ